MPSDPTALATIDTADVSVDEVIEAGAIEQARWRLAQLQASFSSTMVILADMHQDEDWRHLTDAEGRPYTSFTAMLSAELEISDSWARRQQQGVVDLVVPLRQLTHPDTRIPITGRDVAVLGKRGAEYVCQHAPTALAGLDSPREQEQALRELLDTTRARISGEEPGPETVDGDIESADRPIPPRTVSDDQLVWDLGDDTADDLRDADDSDEETVPRGDQEEPAPRGDGAPAVASSTAPAASGGANAGGTGGGKYGVARTAAAAAEDSTDIDENDDGDGDTAGDTAVDPAAQEAVSALAALSDGDGDPFAAAVRVVAAASPAADTDLDLEVVTAAMLKIGQVRSALMARNSPKKR